MTCVVFDLFGVVVTSGFASSRHKLSGLLARSPDQIATVYRKWEIPFDLGKINSEIFWKNINEDLGTAVDWRLLDQAVLESYSPIPGSFELLQRYWKVCPLFLLSNTRKEWFQYLDRKFDILKYFQRAFFSYDIGLRKPDPEIFSHLIMNAGSQPHDLFLVDDEPPNVLSAANLGISGIVFRSAFEAEVDIHARLRSDAPKYEKSYAGVLLMSDDGKLILQRREQKAGISNPGLITTFGGVVKNNESFSACAIRELREEVNLDLNADDLLPLTELAKPDRDNCWTFCRFYLVTGINAKLLKLCEGESIEVLTTREAKKTDKLSPVCRVVVQHYLQHSANE